MGSISLHVLFEARCSGRPGARRPHCQAPGVDVPAGTALRPVAEDQAELFFRFAPASRWATIRLARGLFRGGNRTRPSSDRSTRRRITSSQELRLCIPVRWTHPAPQGGAVSAHRQRLDPAAPGIVRHFLACAVSPGRAIPASQIRDESPLAFPFRESGKVCALGYRIVAGRGRGSPRLLLPKRTNRPKFRFARSLGRGGRGCVYQAEARVAKRPVASSRHKHDSNITGLLAARSFGALEARTAILAPFHYLLRVR